MSKRVRPVRSEAVVDRVVARDDDLADRVVRVAALPEDSAEVPVALAVALPEDSAVAAVPPVAADLAAAVADPIST